MRRAGKGEGRFDGFGVAAARAVIAGRVDTAKLPRLSDLLAGDGGDARVDYRIAGSADVLGHPALEIALTGSVPLTCQRCLRTFGWPVRQTTLVRLARDEAELVRIDQADHEHEAVLANAPLDALTLIEDELLLTLPYVPRCPEAECPALRGQGEGSAFAPDANPAFGVLAQLRPAGGKKAPR
jgi:uncharacterized protein